jgi:hypothetical protein
MIVDLSYTENSMGRGIAIETGARYISGLTMFKAQAQAQRDFWIECERDLAAKDATNDAAKDGTSK